MHTSRPAHAHTAATTDLVHAACTLPVNTHMLTQTQAVTLVEAGGSLLQPFSTDFMQHFSPAFVADHAVAM